MPASVLGESAKASSVTALPRPVNDRVQLGAELRTVGMVWRRELIRFFRNRIRIVGGLIQPLLFLFVLGYGLGSVVGNLGGLSYRQVVFPGSMAMSVVMTAIFSAISIVWDREFGFLREMLVAPVSRASIILGKTLGGATVSTFQGAVLLVLAPVVGIRLSVVVVVEILGTLMLMAFALTAFGVFVASRMKKMEGFQAVMQFLLFPMIFISGAMFPVGELPLWLAVINRLDPLTYAVDPVRRLVLAGQPDADQTVVRHLFGVAINGQTLPIWGELCAVGAFAAVFLALAVAGFSKTE